MAQKNENPNNDKMTLKELKKSGVREVEKIGDMRAIVYTVEAREIDLGALEIEKRSIEEQLAHIVSDEELLEWARRNYPHRIDAEKEAGLRARLDEIKELLE